MDRRLRQQLRRVRDAGVDELLRLGRDFERHGDSAQAASCYDVAYGLDPSDVDLVRARASVLDRLAVQESGITWRYVPAGTLEMGADDGEPDERPVHPVALGAYWIADVPITWEQYHALAGWAPPPEGWRGNEAFQLSFDEQWSGEEWKIRLPFCGDDVRDYAEWSEDSETYRTKPVVAVSWPAATAVAAHASTASWTYRLPTEAEWERAARGGLVGARYPWGDAPPDGSRCDCDARGRLGIRPSRETPANGYGLHGMCGGVWEWTADHYDAGWYARSPDEDAAGPSAGEERVIRGGSWADSPEVCTVSFRASCPERRWRPESNMSYMTPCLGFRLVRVATPR